MRGEEFFCHTHSVSVGKQGHEQTDSPSKIDVQNDGGMICNTQLSIRPSPARLTPSYPHPHTCIRQAKTAIKPCPRVHTF